nr:MAG TPA: hypothetical protein [Bacteriophage sp.]
MKKFFKNFKCAVSNTPVIYNFGIQKSVENFSPNLTSILFRFALKN